MVLGAEQDLALAPAGILDDLRGGTFGLLGDLVVGDQPRPTRFIVVSDLLSLLELAITAKYRFALRHAATPGHNVLLAAGATEELLGWHARAAVQPS